MAKMYNGDLVAPVLNPQQISDSRLGKYSVTALCSQRASEGKPRAEACRESLYITTGVSEIVLLSPTCLLGFV